MEFLKTNPYYPSYDRYRSNLFDLAVVISLLAEFYDIYF